MEYPKNQLMTQSTPKAAPAAPENPDYKEYPRFKYHAEKGDCVVVNAEQDAALGAGWYNTPTELAMSKGAPVEAAPAPIVPAAAVAPDFELHESTTLDNDAPLDDEDEKEEAEEENT